MDNANNNEKMMWYLNYRLKNEQNIDWDSYEHHMTCLNHVINLVIDDFMKIIKEYMKEIKDYLHIMNDDDEFDDESDDEFDDSISMKMKIERIMSIIFKLWIIEKIESLYQTH